MQSRTLNLQIPPDAARAYEMAPLDERRRVDDALRMLLRELMKSPPATVGDPTAATRAARHHQSTEIHHDVLKISGMVPPDVDARAEYLDYIMKKHQ